MSTATATSKITHKILVGMYTKKPKINEDGGMVFKKSKTLLISGIILVVLFSLCAVVMDDFVVEIMQENSIDSSMAGMMHVCGYALAALFIFIGMRLILMYCKYEIIVSKDAITSKKMFSTKTIKLFSLEAVTFSNAKGLVFKGDGCKIPFGNFTAGLVQILEFIDENIPKHKSESALVKARKMLRMNRIDY